MITGNNILDLIGRKFGTDEVELSDADKAIATKLIQSGERSIELEAEKKDLNQRIKDNNEIVMTDAPQALLSDMLKAMSSKYGNLKEYYKYELGQDCPWDLKLYRLPDTEEWKKLKKGARANREAENLHRLDETFESIQQSVAAGTATITQNKIVPLRNGGHKATVVAKINQDQAEEKIDFVAVAKRLGIS